MAEEQERENGYRSGEREKQAKENLKLQNLQFKSLSHTHTYTEYKKITCKNQASRASMPSRVRTKYKKFLKSIQAQRSARGSELTTMSAYPPKCIQEPAAHQHAITASSSSPHSRQELTRGEAEQVRVDCAAAGDSAPMPHGISRSLHPAARARASSSSSGPARH